MAHSKTPRTDALFGVFLQDVREIRQKHPRSFGNIYFRFDYVAGEEDEFSLSIEPGPVSKSAKKEILQAFDKRLNES